MAKGPHPIESLMNTTMVQLKDMIDVNTVIGDAVETKTGTVIVPVSRVSFGFVAGGGEYGSEDEGENAEGDLAFAGGTGAGVTVQPVGFLVVEAASVRLVPVDDRAMLDRILDMTPQLLDQLSSLWQGRTKGG